MHKENNNPLITVPQVSLPKGGGSLKGLGETFQPNSFSGTGSLSIPIYTSPCRGFEPKLTLDYHSASGNGSFGLGFLLSIPNISRKTEKKLPKYDYSDTFVLSNAEDLVAIKSTKSSDEKYDIVLYQPRIEGVFAKIEYWKSFNESFWKVTTKDNITSIFGRSENARVFDPDDVTHIFQWLLEETYDSKGNKIKYSYHSENIDNISAEIYEQNRDHSANKYINSIKYGNILNSQGQEIWSFEVIFDYGEYNIDNEYLTQKDCDPYQPVKKWFARDDSFSTYKSGFEIRTHRLCRNILMFHNFPDKFGDKPSLVRCTGIEYSESSAVTQLKAVNAIGYRRCEDGSYASKSLPPLEFEYSAFKPDEQKFDVIKLENEATLPGHIEQSEYNLIDLYGEGISGFLSSNNQTTLYWKPKGNGEYELPETPEQFPIERNLGSGEYSLVSLEGNGKLDLVVGAAQRGGFYQCNPDGSWEPYIDFQSYPLEYVNPNKNMIDVNGDGIPDIMIIENEGSRIYTSLKKDGYAAPVCKELDKDFPCSADTYNEEIVTFSDFLGDGISHRIRIRNGSVECWPHLGYGKFGKKILLGNAPIFDEKLDASRLFLADLDGSGTVDLIYAFADHIEIYFNQSGNKFSKMPLCITLPENFSSIDQISFGDVHGNGAASLVFTKMSPEVKHYYYEFIGGNKPYLMTGIANNLGSITKIYYKSSVKYYLEDKKSGYTWKNKIPFPVQVVDKYETIDQLSRCKLVTRYAYHDGYYDYEEREFRGFGFVEEWDSEDFSSYNQQSLIKDVQFNSVSKEFFIPPVLTKRWYHTGDIRDTENSSRREQYYDKDLKAYRIPNSTFDYEIASSDAETIRQAYRAMKGQMLREEIYAIDNQPGISEHPYSITESNFHVRLVHPGRNNELPVFFVHNKENITYHYERNPKDPRIEHDFTLEVGKHGEVTKTSKIYYPRRVAKYSNQSQLKAIATINSFIEKDTDCYLHSIPCEIKNFEIGGIEVKQGDYLSYDDIREQILNGALNNVIAYNEEFISGQKQARFVDWRRDYYWNDFQDNALPFGEITSQALLHHSETAAFTDEYIQKISSNRITSDVLANDGGYISKDGYWWNCGLVSHYYKTVENKFCLAYKFENSFVSEESSLFQKTEIGYDSYLLSVTNLKQYISQEIYNETTAEIDYITLQPWQIKDINNNTSQAIFDPLGMVIATSSFGIVDGKAFGDMDLRNYQNVPNITFDKVVESVKDIASETTNPFLQKASTYFFYDMYAFKERQQPVRFISLVRATYASELIDNKEGKIQVDISYTDGFGRELEKKVKTNSGEAIVIDKSIGKAYKENTQERWIVSGRTVYNNKGKPIMQYQPYFSGLPDYEDQGKLEVLLPPPTIIYYDPLLREIRKDIPKGRINDETEILGFFTKVEFTPWEEKHYDQNDTVKDSSYYQAFQDYINKKQNLTEDEIDEKNALDKAACSYGTPEIKVFDTMGHCFMQIQNNLGEILPKAFDEIIKNTGGKSDELWNELIKNGYLEQKDSTQGGWVTSKFNPYSSVFSLQLSDTFMRVEEDIIKLLKQNCLIMYQDFDTKGRILVSIDPRLYYSNTKQKTDYYNFKYYYAMNGEDPILNDSADAGPQFHLKNIFENLYWSWTARNFNQQIYYDRLNRKIRIQMKGIKNDGSIATDNAVEIFTYGENQTDSDKKNLRGQLYEHKDQSGIITNSLYGLKEELLETSRQLTSSYKESINWANSVQLENEIFKSKFIYDDLKKMISQITPDGSETINKYNHVGQLDAISVKYSDGSMQDIIQNIDYDANGHRTIVNYANGSNTQYSYDTVTLQMIGLKSIRENEDSKGENRNTVLQDIKYTYDPFGNITRIRDKSFRTVFNNNQKVEPLSDYTYDSLNRLIIANGRMHSGINALSYINNCKNGDFKQSSYSPLPNDGEKLENYYEKYSYDEAGNLIRTEHLSSNPWTRTMEIMPDSNRLKSAVTGKAPVQEFSYDKSGNQKQLFLNSSVDLTWSCCENLVKASVIQRPDEEDDCDYYTYDNKELRTRKVSERYSGAGIVRKEEKIYLGDYEIKRIKTVDANGEEKTVLNRQTLRVMDDKTCTAIIHYWTQDDKQQEVDNIDIRSLRFQMNNHLGSVSMELDGNASLISYEEYFPYGGTAIIAGDNQREVELKEYRYSGKECDDSTGFYYFGARFYAPWLGRWMKPDPAGTVDGLNLYAFVRGNPVGLVDEDGRMVSPESIAFWKNLKLDKSTPIRSQVIAIASKPPPKPPPISLYHATTEEGEAGIRGEGINLWHSRNRTDFGKGFYTTRDLAQAQEWSQKIGTEENPGVVLEFRVPHDFLTHLEGVQFQGHEVEFERIVFGSRNTGKLQHNHDYVEGPMLMNPAGVREDGKAPIYAGNQVSFHTKKATRALIQFLLKETK